MSDTGTSPQKARQLRDEWIKRVLGVDIPGGGAADLDAWVAALDSVENAFNDVSAQIDVLRQALADQDEDEDLVELARSSEFGINGFTDGKRVALTGTIIKAGRSDPFKVAAGAGAVLAAAKLLLDHIETDGRIVACENNPPEVPVSIRDTMRAPLVALIDTCTRLSASA